MGFMEQLSAVHIPPQLLVQSKMYERETEETLGCCTSFIRLVSV